MKGNRIFLMVVCSILALALNAGGKQEPAPSTDKAVASGKTEVIRIWSNDAHNRDEYTETIKKFHETIGKDKGIKIEYTVYGGDYYNSLDVAIAAGEEPHMFKSMKTGQYAQTGKIVPISELPGGNKLIEETKKYHFEDIGMFGGVVYAIPIRVTTQNMIYNKELFARLGIEVPVSWNDLREAAKKITRAGGGKIFGFGIPMKYTNYKYYHVAWPAAPSVGTQFFNHKTGKFDFQSLEPFFNLMLQLKADGSLFPGFETLDYDTLRAQFAEGNIGMYFGASFDVGVLYDQFPAKFDWGVAPIPVMDPNRRYKQIGTPGAFYVVSSRVKKEKLEEKVMEVYKLFVSIEHLALTYERGKDIPIRGEEVTKHAGEPKRKQWPMFTDLKNVYVRLAYPESKITVEGDNYTDMFSKILTGMADPKKALADLDKRYNTALQKSIDGGKVNIKLYIDPNYDENVKYIK